MEIGRGEIPDEMVAAIICERYGWTWEEYQNQPWWFIEAIKRKLRTDAEHEKKEMEKAKAKTKGY